MHLHKKKFDYEKKNQNNIKKNTKKHNADEK